MANFICNPHPYLPVGAHVEDGWHRPARSRIALGGEPPRRHEDYAIIVLHPEPLEEVALAVMHDVADHLEQVHPVRILSQYRSPLGLGLVQFQSPQQRQSMIDLSPVPYVNNSQIRVIKHDEARNLRACNYSRICRLMVLAFPLDYQNMDFFRAAVAPFGRLITWYEGPNKSKTFLDCLVLSPDRIPRSMVVSQGATIGGNGRSWSASVFIIGGQFPDVFPADEDPVPVDGNPHPGHGFVAHVNPQINQQWVHDLVGAADVVMQDFSVNNNMMNEAVGDLKDNSNMQPADNAEWPQWDNVAKNAMHQPEVPLHPDNPQDSISFDQSGSSVAFLRANGPDVLLSVEMITQGLLGKQLTSSSSSSEVSSMNVETQGPTHHDNVATQFSELCKVVLPAVLVAKSRPVHEVAPSPTLKRSWNAAFGSIVQEQEDLSRAIVPYQPVLHSVLMQIWPQKVDEFNASESAAST
ncbi:unnamed protein product [Urochloa humidicola]